VAVLVGYFAGGESIGSRTIFGTLLILLSVVTISTLPSKRAVGKVAAVELSPAKIE